MKALLLAVIVMVGCSTDVRPELVGLNTYCVQHHLRYEAWMMKGKFFVAAWPESQHWYVQDHYGSAFQRYEVGQWHENAGTLQEAASQILSDIESNKPREVDTDFVTRDLGAR